MNWVNTQNNCTTYDITYIANVFLPEPVDGQVFCLSFVPNQEHIILIQTDKGTVYLDKN